MVLLKKTENNLIMKIEAYNHINKQNISELIINIYY